MMVLCINDSIYTGCWALGGSLLGFFSFRFLSIKGVSNTVRQCILSLGIGVMIAFTTTEYLITVQDMPKKVSMMIGALAAFGLPDILLRYYPQIIKYFVFRVTKITADSVGSKVND